MKKKTFRKVICLFLSVAVAFSIVAVSASAAGASGSRGSNRDTAATLEEMKNLVGVLSYDEYLKSKGDSYVSGLPTISVDLTKMLAGSNGVIAAESDECTESFEEDQRLWSSFGDNWENSVYLPATGSTTWSFTVPDGAASYYYIKLEYYSCSTSESSISSIERKLLIDGKAPFSEASYITLNKNWSYDYDAEVLPPVATDKQDGVTVSYPRDDTGYYKVVSSVKNGMETVTKYKLSQDINGNSMAPTSVQTPSWNTYYVQDSTGYYEGYFRFYLLNGTRQITLSAEREPVIIKSIELVPYDPAVNELPTYEDVKAEYEANGYKPAGGSINVIQAEFPDYISDSSVSATNDNTSSATYPSIPKAQLYNVIGENSYNSLGQWAAYKFTVNETGLYKLSMRYLQSTLQGMYVCRAIKLAGGIYGLEDGTPSVPFKEAYDAQFNYNKSWQSDYVADSNGNVFEFYFEEGVEYTLCLECSLGSLKELIQRVENSVNTLNECYLKIIQLTGSSPDENATYDFYTIMPDVLVELLLQAIELMDVKAELEALCGTNGSHIATLETVAILLDKMGSDEGDEIASNLSNLKSYLGTLGTWVNDSKKGTLVVDSITIVPSGADEAELKQIPRANANFFQSLWFEVRSFFCSFFTDYDAMGLTEVPDADTTTIEVWLASGRDQSQIWRSMIDAKGGFTESTGTAVTLKLVTGGTLLPSILAGKGPDVYIGLGASDVINYAIRDAVIGLSGNDRQLSDIENEIFTSIVYTFKDENDKIHLLYKDENGYYTVSGTEKNYEVDLTVYENYECTYVSESFNDTVDGNYVDAAMDTVTLLEKSYGIPQTMTFAMMFYRMDVLADLGIEVPETWEGMLSILPVLQSNNMSIGVDYISALDFMLYQDGGNMWKYTDNPEYAGAKVDLDSNVALEAFEFVCSLYSDYSFPVSYDASNRFRTGEMPIIVGGYSGIYNTLTVYATEIDGMWSFCPLPGVEGDDGTINYNSLAGISATVILHGCDQLLAAWQFVQWQTSADVQANYGNRMVALIGPSAKYEAANVNAIKNLSWTASEREAIEDQMAHMSSIVNYPGSYIIARYMKFAFLDVINDGANPTEALTGYIDAINSEITRKREEFDLKTLKADEEPDYLLKSSK